MSTTTAAEPLGDEGLPIRWAKVVDHTSCIGCHACTTACKSENEVPLGVTRTYVKAVDVGVFPQARRAFQVTRCNQCEDAPCTIACPTSAMYRRDDGIVDFDKSACIGCKACIAACPYDAIFINPDDGSAEKCNFCAHRIDVGLEPACVTVCPTQAILVGDLNDPGSKVAQIAYREPVQVRRPEKETLPKLFYRGAHQATLDPLAARRPDGGLFMWSEQQDDAHHVVSGHPADGPERETRGSSSAAAVLAYDVAHSRPWDWRVSLYTLTKGIAAGAFLVAQLLALLGVLAVESNLFQWGAPIVSGIFLALTGGLLIWDLEHPERFYLIFTRPQWKSWLVRGGFVLGAYGAALAIHCALAWFDPGSTLQEVLSFAAVPVAVLAAVYTAYLFAQSKARDLWQSPLLPPHLLVQAMLAGSAALLPVAWVWQPFVVDPLLKLVFWFGLFHLLMVWGETTLTHVTAHARLASWEMVRGRYRGYFWSGVALVAVAMVTAIVAPDLAHGTAVAALLGLLAFEHAYVQAGQSVPLA